MIKYEPSKIIRKIAPEKKIKRMVTENVTLKKAALSFVDDLEMVSKKHVTEVALNVIKDYKKRIKADPDIKDDLIKDPAQLIQRVQNAVITQITASIGSKYAGESYIWLPSDAEEPDPEHQLNYGKTFIVGDGEMPGDRYGCKCGMQILTEDTQLEL